MGAFWPIVAGIACIAYGVIMFRDQWGATTALHRGTQEFWRGQYRLIPFSRKPASVNQFRWFSLLTTVPFGVLLIVLGALALVHAQQFSYLCSVSFGWSSGGRSGAGPGEEGCGQGGGRPQPNS